MTTAQRCWNLGIVFNRDDSQSLTELQVKDSEILTSSLGVLVNAEIDKG